MPPDVRIRLGRLAGRSTYTCSDGNQTWGPSGSQVTSHLNHYVVRSRTWMMDQQHGKMDAWLCRPKILVCEAKVDLRAWLHVSTKRVRTADRSLALVA
jgi:hypothetical protein